MNKFRIGIIGILVIVGIIVGGEWLTTAVQGSKFHEPTAATLSQADQDVQDIERFLKQSGIAHSSLANSKVEVCYNVDTGEGIGFRRNPYRYCYLRYVRGYTTDLTKQVVVQKISAAPPIILKKLGDTLGAQYSDCEITSNVLKQTLRYREAYTGKPINDVFCGIPSQLQGLNSTVAVHLDKELDVRKLSQFDPSSIGNSTNQVWLSYDVDYYQAKI